MRIKVPVVKRENGVLKLRFVDVIIDVALGMLVATIFVKIAFNTYFGTSTSGFDSNTLLLWEAIPWVILASIMIAFLRYVRNPSSY